jgi:hypothetical protein
VVCCPVMKNGKSAIANVYLANFILGASVPQGTNRDFRYADLVSVNCLGKCKL